MAVQLDVTNRTISVTEPITVRALYSKLKELFVTPEYLSIPWIFEQFGLLTASESHIGIRFINGWRFADAESQTQVEDFLTDDLKIYLKV